MRQPTGLFRCVVRAWYSDASPVLDLDGAVRPVTALAQTAEVTVGADGFTTTKAD